MCGVGKVSAQPEKEHWLSLLSLLLPAGWDVDVVLTRTPQRKAGATNWKEPRLLGNLMELNCLTPWIRHLPLHCFLRVYLH